MNAKTTIGGLLVLLGAFLILMPGGSFGPGQIIGYFWPSLFILPLSLFFHWLYYHLNDRRASGLLIPGGILLTVGVVCQISMLFDFWAYMWPGFILAPAVGLLEFYWLGYRNRWLLIPINILAAISLLFFAVFGIGSLFNVRIFGQSFVAVALVLVGGVLLLTQPRRNS